MAKMNMAQFQVKLIRWTKKAPKEVKHHLLRAAMMVSAHVRKFYLSGQALKVRTGTGRRSITERIRPGSSKRIMAQVGTNVWYMRLHEEERIKKGTQFLRPSVRDRREQTAEMVLEGFMEAYGR